MHHGYTNEACLHLLGWPAAGGLVISTSVCILYSTHGGQRGDSAITFSLSAHCDKAGWSTTAIMIGWLPRAAGEASCE